jgi:hypothetical protein
MSAQCGKRLRKGAANTAVAAVVVAALAASQAPGLTTDGVGRRTTGSPTPKAMSGATETATGNSRYYTDLPPLESPVPAAGTSDASGAGGSERGIPASVLDAYKKAEAALRESKPGCNLPWQLLAAIGNVESGQARGGRVDANGTTLGDILGPQLSGGQFASIRDTDNGAYDGDSSYDRAVGPMQFIPSTWEWAGRDGNGDGREDPDNIYDSALAAGHYLCRFDWNLSDQADLRRAILSYNNSTHYLNTVLRWLEYYREGVREVPDGTGALPAAPSGGGNSGSGASPSPDPEGTRKPTPPKPAPEPDEPGKGGGSGSPDPSPPPTPTSPPPTPTDTVDHLEDASTGRLTATAGDTFAEQIAVRTQTTSGKAVAKVRVRFTITGDTDATFTGGETVATVVTGITGTAEAPELQAGEKAGDFTVQARVVGRSLPGLDYKATVTARQAEALARTTETALTCVLGGEFAEQVEVKATYQGEVADGVAATATLVKSADDPAENDKGPYFRDADGTTVRTLTGLATGKDGLLKLPKLYADDATGTFLLRITSTGGAALTVELTVALAEPASPAPTES